MLMDWRVEDWRIDPQHYIFDNWQLTFSQLLAKPKRKMLSAIIKFQQPHHLNSWFWYQNYQLDKTKQYLMSADQLPMSNIWQILDKQLKSSTRPPKQLILVSKLGKPSKQNKNYTRIRHWQFISWCQILFKFFQLVILIPKSAV